MSRVAVISPRTFGYEERIPSAVRQIGHEVIWCDERIGNSFFIKVLTRLKLLWALPWLKKQHVFKLLETLNDWNASVLLVVNPETLRGVDIRRIKKLMPDLKIHVYKWDSLRQKPIDEEFIKLADKVYSFDPEDSRNVEMFNHLPLFHCHKENSMNISDWEGRDTEFLFVGSAQIHRIKVLAKLIKFMDLESRSYRVHLVSQSTVHHLIYVCYARLVGYTGVLSRVPLSYEKYLEAIKRSVCVVDIEYPRQSGLTMRTIEVLFSGSSILTTNKSIEEYSLADIGGVYLLDSENISLPSRQSLSADIKKNESLFEGYSIVGWASKVVTGTGELDWNGRRWV